MSGPWCECGKLYRRVGEDQCDACKARSEGAAAERARLLLRVRGWRDSYPIDWKEHRALNEVLKDLEGGQ